jgi:molybdate transport system substrate-binding protein
MDTVPAGEYAKQVLEKLQVWEIVKEKAVLTKDIHTVLTYVETGNVEAGIVFSTVAVASDKVKVAALQPIHMNQSHFLVLLLVVRSILRKQRCFYNI